jgi:hypothetical protein
MINTSESENKTDDPRAISGAGNSNRKNERGVGMKKAIPLLAAVAVALATLATAGVAVACRNGGTTPCAVVENRAFLGRWYWGKSHAPFGGGFGPLLSVSEEFKENVIHIAESDPDVQNLLNAGYENMCVRPIIKAVVQGNGDVTLKATGAIVTLHKNGSWATVQVDLEAGKVTRIVKLERTVIEKS